MQARGHVRKQALGRDLQRFQDVGQEEQPRRDRVAKEFDNRWQAAVGQAAEVVQVLREQPRSRCSLRRDVRRILPVAVVVVRLQSEQVRPRYLAAGDNHASRTNLLGGGVEPGETLEDCVGPGSDGRRLRSRGRERYNCPSAAACAEHCVRTTPIQETSTPISLASHQAARTSPHCDRYIPVRHSPYHHIGTEQAIHGRQPADDAVVCLTLVGGKSPRKLGGHHFPVAHPLAFTIGAQ